MSLINKSYQHICLLLCLFLLSAAYSYGQATASIYGRITDSTNAPVQDVMVSLFGLQAPPVYTDKDGKFEYQIPANTKVTVVFSHISFEQIKVVLKLKPGQKIKVDKTMLPSKSTFLKSVQITDKQNRSEGMIRLNPKIVTHIPSPSEDFNTILFTQPGVSSRNELSSDYSVRGGNYDENLVYVNGIEIYRPFLIHTGEQEGLSFVNPDLVSSILFSAGGFEAKYGDKMSSVLDIQYRHPRKFAGSVSGSLLGSDAHLEGISKDHRFTWLTGIRYKSNQYVLKSLDTKGDYKPAFEDVQTFLTYDLTDRWELDFLGNYTNDKYRFVPQDRDTRYGTINDAMQFKVYFDGQEIDQFQTSTGAVSAIFHPSDKLHMQFIGSAYNSIEDENADIEGQYFLNQLETDFGKSTFGQVAYNLGVGTFLNHDRNTLNAFVYNFQQKGYVKHGKSRLLWGAKYQKELINDQLSQWNMVDSAGYSLPQYPPNQIILQNVIKSKNTLSSDRVMGYLENIWNFTTKDTANMSITAGVRANYWDMNKQTVVSPRATFAYKPHWKKDILFRASSGWYYQPPFYRELMDVNGNIHTNVKAQESIHFVVGSDWNFKAWNRPFKFISEAYYKYLNHLNPYEIDNVKIQYYANNKGKGYITGLDMKVNGQFVNGIESWASLSFMDARYNITNDYYYTYYNSDGQEIIPGETYNTVPVDSIKHEPGYIPLPTDERVNFSIFFQDYLPKFPDFKMHLNLLFGTGVPFGPPTHQPYKDTLRMPPYRRVDIGFSYQLLKAGQKLRPKNPFHYFKSVWMGLEVFNLLQISNTISYTWIQDVTGREYAIPNYLTSRELNLKMIIDF